MAMYLRTDGDIMATSQAVREPLNCISNQILTYHRIYVAE
jgi:hypothetical protein